MLYDGQHSWHRPIYSQSYSHTHAHAHINTHTENYHNFHHHHTHTHRIETNHIRNVVTILRRQDKRDRIRVPQKQHLPMSRCITIVDTKQKTPKWKEWMEKMTHNLPNRRSIQTECLRIKYKTNLTSLSGEHKQCEQEIMAELVWGEVRDVQFHEMIISRHMQTNASAPKLPPQMLGQKQSRRVSILCSMCVVVVVVLL